MNARSFRLFSWHLVSSDLALWNLPSDFVHSDVRGMQCHFEHDDYTYLAHNPNDPHAALVSIDAASGNYLVGEEQPVAGADGAGSRDVRLGKRVE